MSGILFVLVLLLACQAPAPEVSRIEADLLAKARHNVEQHRKGEIILHVQSGAGSPLADARVRIRQVRHEFPFGCIAFDLVWSDALYKPELWKQRFSELFNFAVFPFYWARYEPEPRTTMRGETVAAIRWCQANGITTKGHPLVWTNPSGLPKWVQQQPPEKSEALMLERVRREVGTFSGLIDIWDVVNEPIHCRAWRNVEANAYIQEPIEAIADYVDKAFRAAHEANPKAHLILNEFYTIAREADRERFYQLVVELKRRGTPISGLGIQAHEPREEWFAPEKVWATLERFAELGSPLHITEYIPQSSGKPITGGWREGTWTRAAQAEFAEQLYRLCFGHPAVASINWWGLSDRRIWLPGGGLIDEEYEPKPVYARLRDLIHEEWMTRLDARTDDEGKVAFKGFFGTYEVLVEMPDGRTLRHEILAAKGQENVRTCIVD